MAHLPTEKKKKKGVRTGLLNMEWTRSETLALAVNSCSACHGFGILFGKRGGTNPCSCVLRAIFRACYKKFRACVTKEKYMTRVTISLVRGRERHFNWSRKDEEYLADFILVARRTLDDLEYRLFKYHFLLGADWRLCCRKLNMERGNFFHTVYKIEQKLGRVFRELQPYSLYPIDEYFASTTRGVGPSEVRPKGPRPLRPPVQLLRMAA
jgi:hypothetical protein